MIFSTTIQRFNTLLFIVSVCLIPRFTFGGVPASNELTDAPEPHQFSIVSRNESGSLRSGSDEALQYLINKAQQRGYISVVIQFKTTILSEQIMEPGSLLEQQLRSEIKVVRSKVLAELSSYVPDSGRVHKYDSVPYLILDLTAAGIRAAAKLPQVIWMREEKAATLLLSNSTTLIGANVAWGGGATGNGQTIAILGSGVESTHPFLSGKVVSEMCYSSSPNTSLHPALCPNGSTSQTGAGAADPACGSTYPNNPNCGHGTHVAGVATGTNGFHDGHSFDGVARDANIIAALIQSTGYFGSNIVIRESDLMSALERIYDTLRFSYEIAAINMSFGMLDGVSLYVSTSSCDSDFPNFASMFYNLKVLADIAPVAATGNGGWKRQIAAPACISDVISVSAVTQSDQRANYANVSSFTDLMAPGGANDFQSNVNIASSHLDTNENNIYRYQAGTSMAAPHVAGAFAVMREAYPNTSVDELLTHFKNTGKSIVITTSLGNYTLKRLDLAGAFEPGQPSSLDIEPLQCWGNNFASWATVSIGNPSYYQLQGASSPSFSNPALYYHGPATTRGVDVTGTTYMRVRACNQFGGCGPWRVGDQPATYTNGCL